MCNNFHSLRSLLAEGVQGMSLLSCMGQSHGSIPISDAPL